MAYENPIRGLYDIYIALITGTTIKYTYLADPQETLDMRKYVDGYLDAYYARDTYEIYKYDEEEFVALGIEDKDMIATYMRDQSSVPNFYKTRLLANRRQAIIDSYVEKNNYYRMLHGLPDLEDNEFIYVDYDTCEIYGIDPTVPVHEIEDKLGNHYITILENVGYIDKLIEENPDKEYLKHIGSKRIDIVAAREAKNFQILYLDKSIDENVQNLFTSLYEQCRTYFMTTIYIYDYRKIIDYYDRFIALCIMVMSLQQLTARSIQASLDREFFDSHAMQALYEMYDIPFFANLDMQTQKAICQSINILIQNKGTNKVIYDIAELLGYSRIDVYKYYLMKEHLMDANGNPIFITKEEFNEDTGEYEEVYDYEKMFDVYFQKVRINDYDYHEALEDQSNRVAYESVTSGDPYWIEDDPLYQEVWESEYNYKETKYLGVTVSYKLSEMLYQNIILIRMIFDLKSQISDITLKLPSLSGDANIPLFDAFVVLCALTSKKYGLNGEVVSKPSQVIHVLSGIQRLFEPYQTMNETMAFNFSWFAETSYEEGVKDLYTYMTEDEIKEFEGYISILTLPNYDNEAKVKAINDMYANIRGLSIFLSDKMVAAKTIDEYTTFSRFYRALYYSKEVGDMFTITTSGEERPATTFLEYLEFVNPTLAEFVETCPKNECHLYIDHVISRLETLIDNLDYMYLINNSTSSIQEVLIALIKFFKSYTTDLIGLNIVYIFDFKPDNLLKLIDEVWRINGTIRTKDCIHFSYGDAVDKMMVHLYPKDDLFFKEEYRLHANFNLKDMLLLTDGYHLIKHLQEQDKFYLTDDVYLHGSIKYPDQLFLTDKVTHFTTTLKVNDFMKLLDEVSYIKKQTTINTEISFFDAVRKLIKTKYERDTNMKLRDECIVVRN